MLAEVAAEATSLSFYFYQMHRDTRVQEMVGDSVIVREVSVFRLHTKRSNESKKYCIVINIQWCRPAKVSGS